MKHAETAPSQAIPQHPVLMGMEMECGFAVLNKGQKPLDRDAALQRFATEVARLEPHLRGCVSPGIFLQNGSRFYTDCGHPEITTPECTSPQEVVRYKLAGEEILSRAAEALNRELAPESTVLLFGNNFDFLSGTTWGCHESYLHQADPELFKSHLVPHLISRIVYTGGGGFCSPDQRFGFLLSPRVAWLTTTVSSESTAMRGILHSRDESLSSAGYRRAHIICGENNRSHLATYLKMGTTALIILLIERGANPGINVAFRNPVGAMRLFAGDPTCKAAAQTVSGQRMTALDVQRHYLELVMTNLDRDFMPPWARVVTHRWAEILDRLELGFEAVKTQLDWALKYDLYSGFAKKSGFDLDSLKSPSPPPEEAPASTTQSVEDQMMRRMLESYRRRRMMRAALAMID